MNDGIQVQCINVNFMTFPDSKNVNFMKFLLRLNCIIAIISNRRCMSDASFPAPPKLSIGKAHTGLGISNPDNGSITQSPPIRSMFGL